MRYYSEKEVARILYDIDKDIKTLPQEVWSYKHIDLPVEHGRIVDLDKVLNWLINEDGRFSMAMSAKIDNALKNAPVILEASATTSSRNRTCPYYQGVCGLDNRILCYCNNSYEKCDTYKEESE